MGIADDFRDLADQIRALQGPGTFDVNPDQLTIRTRVWTGVDSLGIARRGLEPYIDTDLSISQNYRMRQLSTREVAERGGRYEDGYFEIGPITPTWSSIDGTGGYSPAQLDPTGADGTEIIYLVTGTHAGEYQLAELRTDRAFSYYLVLRRRDTTPKVTP